MTTHWLPPGGKPYGDEIVYECPSCGKVDKFSWNPDKWGHALQGVGQCFSCGVAIEGERSLRRLFNNSGNVAEVWQGFRKPNTAASYRLAWDVPECQAYLLGRNVNEELAMLSGAMCDEEGARVCFPVHSPFDFPTMMMTRSIIPGEKGWRSFPGSKENYLFGNLPDSDKIILVEGVFDVLSSGMFGRAAALLGKTMSQPLQWWVLENYSHIVIYLDPPEFEEAALQLHGELLDKGYAMEDMTGKAATIERVYTGKEPSDHGI